MAGSARHRVGPPITNNSADRSTGLAADERRLRGSIRWKLHFLVMPRHGRGLSRHAQCPPPHPDPLRPQGRRGRRGWRHLPSLRQSLASSRLPLRLGGLRREGTEVERRLWRALRETAMKWRFRRQHPIGRRIADFACPARKLVIELDGGQHAEREEADAVRSAEIAAHGYRVIRFWNHEVVENLESVLERVVRELESPPPLPGPLRPQGRRGGEAPSPPGRRGLGEVGATPPPRSPGPPRRRPPRRASGPRRPRSRRCRSRACPPST
ncbi:MAG: DUF559 domain-containing protein [Acetobacteraceae bacterium]